MKKLNPTQQALRWNECLRKHEYKERRVTFGKYVNVMIKDLPIDYLKWAIVNLNGIWAEYFARELQTRDEFKKVKL